MPFLIVFITVVALCVLCILFFWLLFEALDAVADNNYRRALKFGAGALIEASLLVTVAAMGDNAHANQLCLSGHETWIQDHHMVGQVMTQTTHKEWVCDRWER